LFQKSFLKMFKDSMSTTFTVFSLCLVLLCLLATCNGDYIFTFAGDGVPGYYGDGGPATSAELDYPSGAAVSSTGEVYIADTLNYRIRVVSTSGIITTFAGNGNSGYSGDGGPATSAELYYPSGVAVSSTGEVYITDTDNHRVRVVFTNGTITTFAGDGAPGYSGDGGPATSAELNSPTGVAVYSTGEVYIADTLSYCIRVVFTNGTITTFAGDGTPGYSGDGGLATSAELNYPSGVAISSTGEVYIADSSNNRVRVVSTSGIITTFAGDGTPGYSGDGGPATSAELNSPTGVAISSTGEVYIADSSNYLIRVVSTSGIITTFAGDGTPGYSGDGGPATSAELNYPSGVALSSTGEVYITDNDNSAIRIVVANFSSQCLDRGYYQSQSYCICEADYTGYECQVTFCYGSTPLAATFFF
jgi:RPA family protein